MTPHTREKWFRRFAHGLFLTTSVLCLLLCPHSKVEESFQLQAVHDIYYEGLWPAIRTFTSLSNETLPYDHLQYPGVVPRTFVGPIILSTFCYGTRLLCLPLLDLSEYPQVVQFLARFFLLSLNYHAWCRLVTAIDHRSTSKTIGSYLLLITASQFHLPYYSSRMLPNIFAMCMALHSYAYWLSKGIKEAAITLVAAMTVFRCDLLLLLASVGLSWLISRELTVLQALRIGLLTMLVSLLITVPMDSLLWQKWVWPEGTVLYSNTVLDMSAEYGLSPWHWYWLSALPRALLLTALFTPMACVRIPEMLVAVETYLASKRNGPLVLGPIMDYQWLPILLPALGFVALYSCLGHKELRFLFPVLPLFNLAAAIGFARVHQARFPLKDKAVRFVSKIMYAASLSAVLVTLVASLAFVGVSRWNYPGGDALNELGRIVQESKPDNVHVYVDVASAMTGISKFGQRAVQVRTPTTRWTFDKAGYESGSTGHLLDQYTYVLSENKEFAKGFRVVKIAQGNPRLDLRHGQITTQDALYVLERVDETST